MTSRSHSVIALLAAVLVAGCSKQSGSDLAASDAALVPPPPVNQNLGIYDASISVFTASVCLGCHGTATTTTVPLPGGGTSTVNYPACTDSAQVCPQVADRHHAILSDPIKNPPPFTKYTCNTCHQSAPGTPSGMTVTVDCVVCHTTSPHHTTVFALNQDCQHCHGGVINNPLDNHYIPTYPVGEILSPRSVTPGTGDSQCRVLNADGSCRAGACSACHRASNAVTPAVSANSTLHHGTGIGTIAGTSCNWCHGTTQTLDIRTCERCHGPASLHAIGTSGAPAGNGHIGGDQDCWGCHGNFAKYELPPNVGPNASKVASASVVTQRVGTDATVTLTGESFKNSVTYPDNTTKTFTPKVVVEVGATKQVLEPTAVTETSLTVVVPAAVPAGNAQLRVVKDLGGPQEIGSNKFDLVRLPATTITAVAVSGNTVTIDGAGFGPSVVGAEALKVGAKVGDAACALVSWSDTQIVCTSSAAVAGATVSVVGANNTLAPVTAVIGGVAPAPAPTQAPDPTPTQTPDPTPTSTPAPTPTATPGPVANFKVSSGASAVCNTLLSCASSEVRASRNVSFDGSGSVYATSYRWTVATAGGRVVRTSTAKALQYSFSRGQYKVTLVVSNGVGATSQKSVAITAK